MSAEDPRFAGIARLYGVEGLARLRAAHVAVVGIGGVGSWAAEAMARSGVGEISLFDMDDVCVSNSNRQLHALDSTVGRPKVEVMAERIRAINPDCIVHAMSDFVTRDTMAECITPDMDFVIDCIDSVNAKAALISWCKRRKIQMVTTGGAGGQIDPTLIQIADLNRTFNDPLASKVRSTLRRDYGFSRTPNRHYSVPCVFSTEQLRYPKPDGSICLEKKFVGEGVKLDCAGGFGAVMMVTATFGMVAATRAVDKLVSGTRRPSERVKPAAATPDQA
ncbi:tRNA cyclic N6-threonylcarbamoyladenosine(37) synthase TcdA [Pseudomonas syringae pv. aptata]|jgi:tRNA A37 threonylcarbamoyladenosine dehydratase|uniref:tRNA cyclic N6-threonylcarbamoyladenosine(37) synthase TcdA n=2 Tax=Pseudomonas syringae TaxID=317 RepID=UPI0002A79844|nr:tRNA cyclic N6-threonylcarbamoyladenosine(37) synthase TcdA [Pseudomonas syringae]ELQ03015.1 ThiF family protein [Pseudomonas syringae BRIP34876]ELQ03198.1 ThiF family protein [Pseudomonas syringae BRIP34881]KZL40876.1 thiamine biosynthesis protein ThiF [Pseudomonas syringae pv. syringae]MCK0542566.1 tRNA cyclic N6-threonylcarbamoyladenosine(37) synthase TcdA [Pseudomonas syringae pv. aptata]UZS74010.1 tRNA cyclic N6-threonylcarbamoyladenosine(37) synthase TcdA [Pseudomonas syringae]